MTFKYLGFPAGRAHCLKVLKLVPGSGPVKKRGNRQSKTSAYTKHSTQQIPCFLIDCEDVNSDAVQDRILQSAGRAARRVVQQKIHSNFSESISDRDNSATFDDNEKHILAMENFNGLQEWNARADSLKELIKVSVDLEDPIEVVQQLRLEYREYLKVPYVNMKSLKRDKVGSTPFSAPPKIVHDRLSQQATTSEAERQVWQ